MYLCVYTYTHVYTSCKNYVCIYIYTHVHIYVAFSHSLSLSLALSLSRSLSLSPLSLSLSLFLPRSLPLSLPPPYLARSLAPCAASLDALPMWTHEYKLRVYVYIPMHAYVLVSSRIYTCLILIWEFEKSGAPSMDPKYCGPQTGPPTIEAAVRARHACTPLKLVRC